MVWISRMREERKKKRKKKEWDSRDYLSFDDNTVCIIKKILMRWI
jgi:hypothetical protein